jgi:hypothetical protein
MQKLLAKCVWLIALVAASAAAGGWGYFIWSFDWGTSYRGRGLWLWIMLIPGLLAFAAAFFIVLGAFTLLWQVAFRGTFPDPF